MIAPCSQGWTLLGKLLLLVFLPQRKVTPGFVYPDPTPPSLACQPLSRQTSAHIISSPTATICWAQVEKGLMDGPAGVRETSQC